MLIDAVEMTDLSEHFPNAICAHGKDRNVLVLSKLDTPKRRLDGRQVSYELHHRWLSCDVTEPESWVCVKGSDNTLWSRLEIEGTGFDLDNPTNLFDHFNLF